MNPFVAFLRLVRWPNLAFIIITQILFYYCVYAPLLDSFPDTPMQILFFLLILASVLIAAAGYIINDYFDVQIDVINKPGKIIIDKFIKRRWAIVLHWLFSGAGMLLSLYIGYRTRVWLIPFINFFCVLLLWFYSTTFKKKLLTGNIIIALLSAWVILSVYFFAGTDLFSFKAAGESGNLNVRRFFKYTLLFAGFAFVMTLIREVIKDIEDAEGDRKYNCNTMPIAWGIPATKVFTGVWITVAIAALATAQLYASLSGWWPAAGYILVALILPLFIMLRNLYRAQLTADYHRLSSLVKMVMFLGILSMIFFCFS